MLHEPDENYKTGYIAIFRSIKKHWIWGNGSKKTKLEAWLDLLLLASFQDSKEPFGFDFIKLKRGQLVTSQEKLSISWRWDRNAVRKFLKMLEGDNMIVAISNKKYTMITICNYDSYQKKNPQETNRSATGNQQRSTYKNVNKEKNVKKVVEPPQLSEVVEYFTSSGYTEISAKKAYAYYESSNWHDKDGKKVVSWKQKMISVWFKEDNKTINISTNKLPTSKDILKERGL
jgi:DNA replication protein DnaD